MFALKEQNQLPFFADWNTVDLWSPLWALSVLTWVYLVYTIVQGCRSPPSEGEDEAMLAESHHASLRKQNYAATSVGLLFLGLTVTPSLLMLAFKADGAAFSSWAVAFSPLFVLDAVAFSITVVQLLPLHLDECLLLILCMCGPVAREYLPCRSQLSSPLATKSPLSFRCHNSYHFFSLHLARWLGKSSSA